MVGDTVQVELVKNQQSLIHAVADLGTRKRALAPQLVEFAAGRVCLRAVWKGESCKEREREREETSWREGGRERETERERACTQPSFHSFTFLSPFLSLWRSCCRTNLQLSDQMKRIFQLPWQTNMPITLTQATRSGPFQTVQRKDVVGPMFATKKMKWKFLRKHRLLGKVMPGQVCLTSKFR